jgi:transposase
MHDEQRSRARNPASRRWRRNWTFAGSDAGSRRAAMYTLIETCKLNDIAPRTWLTDVLA